MRGTGVIKWGAAELSWTGEAMAMASSRHLCALPSLPHPPPPARPPLVARTSASAFPIPTLSRHLHRPARSCSLVCSGRRLRAGSDDAAGEGAVVHDEDADEDADAPFDIARLEQYTERVTNEVLRVHAVVDGEEDQVLIFKGFSSSLMKPTPDDPAEAVLPATASIRAIDRIRGPFNPTRVLLIKGGRGLSWQQFLPLLHAHDC